MNTSYLFQKRAKEEIIKIEKERYGRNIDQDAIEVVFQAYVLGQLKATFVVARNTEGRYYEASLNTTTSRLYIDVYSKSADVAVNF